LARDGHIGTLERGEMEKWECPFAGAKAQAVEKRRTEDARAKKAAQISQKQKKRTFQNAEYVFLGGEKATFKKGGGEELQAMRRVWIRGKKELHPGPSESGTGIRVGELSVVPLASERERTPGRRGKRRPKNDSSEPDREKRTVLGERT